MRRKSVEIFLVFLLTASMLLSLVGCSENSGTVYNNRDNSLQNVLDAGQLVVGIDGTFLSMAFKDDSGEYAGFDIDVAKKVCDNLGIELVIKEIEWKDKIDILNAREINCIWSAMSVSSEREKAMDLSEPYLQNEVIIIVPESSDAISKNDLKGKIVGLTGGTTGYEMFYADEIRNEVSIVIDNCDTLLQKLQGGIIEAVVIDSTVGYYFLSHSKEKYFILSESLGSEKYAIGFKKGDIALRDRIQEEINKLRKSGELSEISQKWFGSDITTV